MGWCARHRGLATSLGSSPFRQDGEIGKSHTNKLTGWVSTTPAPLLVDGTKWQLGTPSEEAPPPLRLHTIRWMASLQPRTLSEAKNQSQDTTNCVLTRHGMLEQWCFAAQISFCRDTTPSLTYCRVLNSDSLASRNSSNREVKASLVNLHLEMFGNWRQFLQKGLLRTGRGVQSP